MFAAGSAMDGDGLYVNGYMVLEILHLFSIFIFWILQFFYQLMKLNVYGLRCIILSEWFDNKDTVK